MKINYKKLILIIILTILVGSIFSFFTGNEIYNEIVRPKFSPPGIVFPIAWFILYTLMGISFYIVLQSNDVNKDAGILIYIIQLIFNSLWTLIFFGLKNFLLGFIWIG
ncbi:MAG TPA: tryptophan-rich sensory protein, partial [Bacilli bacterium]|nr:tryptophan-rich sensory protein [Bacilli bacterium]